MLQMLMEFSVHVTDARGKDVTRVVQVFSLARVACVDSALLPGAGYHEHRFWLSQ